MALTVCRECAGPIASNAKACPKCGAAPRARTSVLTWIVVGVFAVAAVPAILNAGDRGSRPESSAAASSFRAVDAPVAPPAADQLRARETAFASKRSSVIATMQSEIAAKRYQAAMNIGDAYAGVADPQFSTLYTTAKAGALASAVKQAAADRRKQGVAVGMSKSDVLASSWGKPEQVNSTTTAFGTREQWVYRGSHNYLYFAGDTLASIQN